MPKDDKILQSFRDDIDAIDDKILNLLSKRTDIVKQVGEFKGKNDCGRSIIRPGREADMVRRVAKKFDDNSLLSAAIAQIWRMIISSSINVEESTYIATLYNKENPECYWLAREYFGPFTQIGRRPTRSEILHDIREGRATVGVLILNDHETSEPWWYRISIYDNAPKIFAKLPFIQLSASKKDAMVAISYVDPEETGDDESLWVIKLDEFIQTPSLEAFLKQAEIQYEIVDECRVLGNPTTHNYLIKIPEFIIDGNAKINKFIDDINAEHQDRAIKVEAYYLGSYAKPIIFRRDEQS